MADPVAAGTVLDLSGGGGLLTFEQTATVNNLTVNFTLDGGGPATRETPAVKIENPISTTETTSTQ